MGLVKLPETFGFDSSIEKNRLLNLDKTAIDALYEEDFSQIENFIKIYTKNILQKRRNIEQSINLTFFQMPITFDVKNRTLKKDDRENYIEIKDGKINTESKNYVSYVPFFNNDKESNYNDPIIYTKEVSELNNEIIQVDKIKTNNKELFNILEKDGFEKINEEYIKEVKKGLDLKKISSIISEEFKKTKTYSFMKKNYEPSFSYSYSDLFEIEMFQKEKLLLTYLYKSLINELGLDNNKKSIKK